MATSPNPKTTKFLTLDLTSYDSDELEPGDIVLFDTADLHIRGGRILPAGGKELVLDTLLQGRAYIPLTQKDLRIHAALRPIVIVPEPTTDGLYKLKFKDGTGMFAFRISRLTTTQLPLWKNVQPGIPQYTLTQNRLDQVASYTLLSENFPDGQEEF